jgi:hypothetical protein
MKVVKNADGSFSIHLADVDAAYLVHDALADAVLARVNQSESLKDYRLQCELLALEIERVCAVEQPVLGRSN